MLEALREMGAAVSEKLYITGLFDTPTGYQGYSGDYLVVSDNESGIHFTGIEKIAADLVDYGFSAGGSSFFTGLNDTPTVYQSGYYLRSTETGIEYIDASGVAADIGDEIVNTIVTGQLLAFTGLSDSPTNYQSGYFVKSTSSGIEYSERVVSKFDSLPTTVVEGKLIEVDCVLYMGCNGIWLDTSKINGPEDEPPPAISPTFEPPSDPSECSFGKAETLYPPFSDSRYNHRIHQFSNYDFTTLLTHRGGFSYYAFYDKETGAWSYKGYWPVNHWITSPSFSRDGKIVAYHNMTSSDANIYVYQYKESIEQWQQLGSRINTAGYDARTTGIIDKPWEVGTALNLKGNRLTWIKQVDRFGNGGNGADLILRTAIWSGSNWTLLPDYYLVKGFPSDYIIKVLISPDGATFQTPQPYIWSEDAETLLYLDRHDGWTIASLQDENTNTWSKQAIDINWLQISSAHAIYPCLSKNGKHIISMNRDGNTRDIDARFVSKINGQWTYRSERQFSHPENATHYAHHISGPLQAFISDDGNSFSVYSMLEKSNSSGSHWSSSYAEREYLFFWDESQFPNPTWQKVAHADLFRGTSSDTRTPGMSFGSYTSNLSRITRGLTHLVLDGPCTQEYLGTETEFSNDDIRVAFLDLTDTPEDYTLAGNKMLRVSSSQNGLEFIDSKSLVEETSYTAFTGLNDTPTGYQGHSGEYLVVNDNESGVHFTGIEKIAADLTDYGFGGSSSTNTQELTEQISQTIVNDNLIILDTDYSFQTKYLNGSISSDSNITDLEFTNLTIGDTYRLSSTVSINSDGTAGDKIKVNYYHDGNKIAAVYSDNISQSVSTSVLFNATSNSLSVSGQNLDANNYIEGNPNEITFTQVEKISNNMIAPEIIAITDGSTQTFNGATMADNNYIKIEGENVSATIEIDGDSFVVAQSGDQMVWDQGGAGETTLSLGEVHSITLSSGRIIEIKFYRSGSLYFSLDKKYEPPVPLVTPSVTATPSVTPSSTPVVTPTVTPTPSTSSIVQNFDTFPSSLPFKLK